VVSGESLFRTGWVTSGYDTRLPDMPHPILSAVFAKYFTPDLYAPLSRKRKQIRVLDLYPAQEPEDPLKGALRRVRLRDEEVGAYETISYVWGDPHIRGSISLNKRLHSIPLTAAEALRRMRYTDRRRTLWIDSVCINQADMLERERQVAMMGQVFSHGQGNLIYLGAGSEDLYRGLDDIHKIYDEMMEDTIEFEDIEATRLPNNDPDHSLLSSNSKTYTTSRIRCLDDYSYIEELFDLPWFRLVRHSKTARRRVLRALTCFQSCLGHPRGRIKPRQHMYCWPCYNTTSNPLTCSDVDGCEDQSPAWIVNR